MSVEPPRPPLCQESLTDLVDRSDGPWRQIRVVETTGSTNADLVALADKGGPEAAEGLVLAADEQTAGRGRGTHGWSSPARSGLAVSMLLRPGSDLAAAVPMRRWSWLPLLAGVSLADAVSAVCGLDAGLKWPNDLLIDGRKAAGILAEVAGRGTAVVLGMGVNVSNTVAELPTRDPAALPTTSLLLAGASALGRAELLAELLRGFGAAYLGWRRSGGDPLDSGLRQAYLARCVTVGRDVRVGLPGGTELSGEAVDVDLDGCLVVAGDNGTQTRVSAGDVRHVRARTS